MIIQRNNVFKALLLALLCLMLGSHKSPDGFIINGNIEGVEDSAWVKLYDLDQQLYLDSAMIKNGKFILKGKVAQPTTCWLQCKGEYAIVQVENTQISFSSPLQDMYLRSEITAGREQALQNDLKKLQQAYDLPYYAAYDSLINKKHLNEENKKKLIERFQTMQAASHRVYIEFGKSHSNSYLGLGILYRNRNSISKDTLLLLYQNLINPYKTSSRARALNLFLQENLAQKGNTFPDFKAKTLKDETFSLSSLKGNYIYLTFWSAGCGACRMENKHLSNSLVKLPEGLKLVNFSIDKNAALWERTSISDGISWTNISDLEGDSGPIKTLYQVQGVPTSYLIDKEGTIIEKIEGFDPNIIERLMSLITASEDARHK